MTGTVPPRLNTHDLLLRNGSLLTSGGRFVHWSFTDFAAGKPCVMRLMPLGPRDGGSAFRTEGSEAVVSQ